MIQKKKKTSGRMRRQILHVFLAAVTCITFLPAGSWAQALQLQEEEAAGQSAPILYTTAITGVKVKQGSAGSTSLKDTVHIKTSGQSVLPRQLNLQQYNTNKNIWVTRAQWMVPGSGSVKVTYPKKYRKKTTGWWRLQVPAVEATLTSPGAQGAVSAKVRVTTRNLKRVKLYSKSACVYNATDETVLYGKQMHTRRKQASTTKLMTAKILLKENAFSQSVKISKRAARQPWGKLSMRAGDRYRLKDMVHALLICSSNDAATALAEHNAGSVKQFAKKMNRQAGAMHLTRTHYKNPHGLDTDGHYTTAYDLAQLTASVSQNRQFRQIIKKKTYRFRSLRYKRKSIVRTTDDLLGWSSCFKGGKTGYDTHSRYCFAGVYQYKGKVYIVTSLGASSAAKRAADQKHLFRYVKQAGTGKY